MLSRQMILRALACLLVGVFSAVSVSGQTLTVNDADVQLSSPPLNTEAGVFLPLAEAAATVGATPLGRSTTSSVCLRTAIGLVQIGPDALASRDGVAYIHSRKLAEAVGGIVHTVAGSVFIEVDPPQLFLIEQGSGGDELLLRLSAYAPVAVDWVDDVTLRLRIFLCVLAGSFEARTIASNHVVSVRAVPTSRSSIDVLVRLTQPLTVTVESQEAFDMFSVRLRFGEQELRQASFPLAERATFYSWRMLSGTGSAVVEGVWIREWRDACEIILESVPSTVEDGGMARRDWIVSASATPIDSTRGVPAGFTMIDGAVVPSVCGTDGAVCIDLFGRLEFADLEPVASIVSGEVSVTATAINRPAGPDELVILQPGYAGPLSSASGILRVITVRNGYTTSVVDSRYPLHDASLVTVVAAGVARDLLASIHVGTPIRVTTTVAAARTFQSIAGGGTLLFHEGTPIVDSPDVPDERWAWATVIADDWAGGLGILTIHLASDDRSIAEMLSVLSQLPFRLCNAVLFADGSLVVRSGAEEIRLVEPMPDEIRLTVIPRTP